MKRNLSTFVASIVVTTVLAFSYTFAQGILPNNFGGGFFGDVSVKIYCTFSNFVPGSDTSACKSNILVTDQSESATSTIVTAAKLNQITGAINRSLTSGANIVYVPGPRGQDGKNGTTTIIYQTVAGAVSASPAAYIYAGGNTTSNPYQTTVPGDIYSTFIHFLTSEKITTSDLISTNAAIDNITATNTFSINLAATNATLTNLVSTKATIAGATIGDSTTTNSTTTNLFATNASITNSTSTTLYSLIANLINLISTNATITNATTTNLFASNASVTNATTTNLFSTKASITEATTTYFFSTWANFLNMFVENLSFKNATGTNLQVANASTTNLVATGTTRISELYVASSTQINSSILSGNATLTSATTTNLFATNASITSATTTTLFAALLNAISATFTNLLATNATLTNATSTNFVTENASTTNLLATNATVTNAKILGGNANFANSTSANATSTNLFSTNASITNATTVNFFVNMLSAMESIFAKLTATDATITNATSTNFVTTNLFASIANIFGGNATLTNATTTSFVTTNASTTNLLATNATVTNLSALGGKVDLGTTTVFGSLIPSASTTWHTLGTLATPWAELFVSSSSVYIGGTKISNVDGNLTWGGNKIVTAVGTSSAVNAEILSASTTNASTTNSEMLNVSGNATLTNATTTSLFANMLNSVNAKIDALVAINATFTNATTSNLFVSNVLGALSAVFTNLTANTANFGTVNATSSVNTLVLNASTTNTVDLVGTNATITNLNAINFSASTTKLVADIASSSTANSLTFSTTTNILQSIVNGKISTTSLESLVNPGNGSNANQNLSANFISDSTTLNQVTDLNINVKANEVWYITATGTISGANVTNGGASIRFLSTGGLGSCNFRAIELSGSVADSKSDCSAVNLTTTSGSVEFNVSGVLTTRNSGVVSLNFGRRLAGASAPITLDAGVKVVAYKLGGADLAEVYYSADSTVEEGDVVALDGTGVSQVSKANKKYQKNVLGIISTKPGLVMGEADGTGKAVIVGLSGRVPVKVTDKNGAVKAGDFLTASDIPGVAMRATGAGQVIGQALTDDMGTGKVMVFIKNTYHDGNNDTDTEETIADKFTQIVKNTLEKLSDVYLNMTLAISSLKANDVTANKVSVQQFCVGGECFTESDMKEFRTYLNSKKESVKETVVVPAAVVPTPEVVEPVVETPVTETPAAETPETPAVETSETPAPVVETTAEIVPEVTN